MSTTIVSGFATYSAVRLPTVTAHQSTTATIPVRTSRATASEVTV